MLLKRKVSGDQRLEYTFRAREGESIEPHGAFLCSEGNKFNDGYYFGLGRTSDETSVCLRRGMGVSRKDWDLKNPVMVPGKKHHVRYQRAGKRVTCMVDGKTIADFVDPSPLVGNRVGIFLMPGMHIDDVKVYTR